MPGSLSWPDLSSQPRPRWRLVAGAVLVGLSGPPKGWVARRYR